MAKGIKNTIFLDLGKGVNLFTRDTMIADNECVDGYNVWAVGKNSIAKRPGVVKFAEVAGVSAIDGLGTYYKGTTRKLFAMAGGALYDVSTGSAVALSAVPTSAGTFTSGKRTDFCQAADKTYIANATESLRYYDGAGTIREQTNGVIGKYLIYYKSCLWLTGNPTAGNETRLYRSGSDSNIGNFTYDATGNPLATSVYVSKADGQTLNAFFKHQDYLYPVKEKSLWRASVGTDTYQLITTELVDPARGCDSHHSIDTVENDNFMFNEIGVFATGYEPNILDQIRTNIVSLRVDPKLKAIQKDRLESVEGVFFDNHYYLSYTSGGGTYNDTILVYDRQRLGWWEFQITDDNGNAIGASCFCEYKDSDGYSKMYFGSPTDGSIYYFDSTAKSDPGFTIVTSLKTKKYGIEKDLSQVKFFLDCEIYFGKTAGEVSISVYIDGDLIATRNVLIGNTGIAGIGIGAIGTEKIGVDSGSLSLTDSGGGDWVKIPLNKNGRNVQVQISDNTDTKSWELNGIIIHHKPLNPLYQPNINNNVT